jgi:very-short-patch-repair endonuclease
MLAIEIDGSSHDYKYEQDLSRQQSIETFGITVIRFEDVRVKRFRGGIARVAVAHKRVGIITHPASKV